MALRVVDISNWQKGIDLDTVMDATAGVIIKATEGTHFFDKCFTGWSKKITGAGKLFGFYHFFRGNGEAEAKYFYSKTKGYFGKGVPILDVEVDCKQSEVQKFVDYIYKQTGVWCWIYTSASMVNTYMNAYVKKHCALWCAGYPSPIPTTWTNADFLYKYATTGCTLVGWQFTDRLRLAGFGLDANIFYISKSKWTNYAKTKTSNKATKAKASTANSSKSTLTLVAEVMQGKHGTGSARKTSLGVRYDEVQKVIDHIARSGVATLAKETINGSYGTGETRKVVLGDKYKDVQEKVNQLLA